MKITAFCGSPRKGGNTEILLRKVLEGAERKGAETVFRNLNEMDIAPCQACMWCHGSETGFCRVQDDMQTVYRDLEESNAVVIGSPIYMWQMSAQTKLMTDRLFATLLPGFTSKVPDRKLVLVFAQGAEAGVFEPYVKSTGDMFSFLKFDLQDVIVAGSAGGPGDVLKNVELVERAVRAGESLFE